MSTCSDPPGKRRSRPFALQGALTAAERLCRAIASDDNEGIAGVTVSIGVATSQAATDDVRSLVHRADEGLYRAKKLGRNRCAATEADAVGQAHGAAAALLQVTSRG